MRRYFLLVLVGAWFAATATGSAQTPTREKAIADFYWRNGNYQSAMFYVHLQESRERQKPEANKEPTKAASLENLIVEALKKNPDIRVAEAKMRESTAQLDRVRLKVASDVAVLYGEIDAAKTGLAEAADRHERASQLYLKGAIAKEEYGAAKLTFLKFQAELAAVQAKLPYLLGRQVAPTADQAKAASLDQMTAEAIKNNPDARVADAKAKEVAAELDRERQMVATKVAILHADIEAAKSVLKEGQDRHERAYRLFMSKAISQEEYHAAKLVFEKLKAELASIEAKMPYLLGRNAGSIEKQVDRDFLDTARAAVQQKIDAEVALAWAQRTLADQGNSPQHQKLRKALDAPIQMDVANLTAKEAFAVVADKFPGVNIVIRAKNLKQPTIDIKFKEPIPLGAALQYIEDELGIVFILRDYGIVVVGAWERMPPGATRLVDFWKHSNAAEVKGEAKGNK